MRQIATQTGRAANQIVQELVTNYLDHEEWFRKEVGKGLASLDDGRSVTHEEVRRKMDKILNAE